MTSKLDDSDAGLPGPVPQPLSAGGRYLIVVTAFLGWMFAGVQMSITALAMRSAAIDLLRSADESLVGQWFAWYVCAFLFGAAAGGWIFGRLGDRFGRVRAMGWSILCLSVFSGLAYWAASPSQLLLLRFLACLGIGGMWPNGVAIVSEAWSDLSRPILAGIMGTAANVGLLLMAVTATNIEITPQSWRWVMLVGATPIVLGLFVLARVPESPRWLAGRQAPRPARQASAASIQVFRPPLRRLILLGIALGTVPLLGGWGASNWMIPWAGEAGAAIDPPDPFLKAWVQFARSLTGMIGSLLGGVIASLVGRRRTYFLMSLGALFTSQYMFWILTPVDDSFLIWASALGFFSGVYFGWLPLFLPELFPTAVRSTGAGVSFNFGRILTAMAVLMAGWLIAHFDGDYARIGRVTSLIYAVGMVVICFAPESSDHRLRD